ncbi:MAG TPA: PhzF family phenazine biosynthesis protein [Myxococcales bacterium]|nr:PhzF family phenazine biosynthesis protein [Myxococcales bacterium]
MRRPCYLVDAFSDRPLSGNAAAVVLDAPELQAADLQRVARELQQAETAFPLPAREPQAAFHLRWFTPFTEVRFCGHATLAALHVLAVEAQRIRVPAHGVARLSFTCKAGLLRAELSRQQGRLRALFETPPTGFARQAVDGALLAALNLVPEMLDPEVAPHRATAEEGNLYLCLRDRESLARVRGDPGALPALASALGVVGFVPFARTPAPGVDAALRAIFADYGVAEDPVTGSASAHLALLLQQLFPAELPRQLVFTQGDEVGRPGRIDIELRPDSAGLRAWITGPTTTVLRGELDL